MQVIITTPLGLIEKVCVYTILAHTSILLVYSSLRLQQTYVHHLSYNPNNPKNPHILTYITITLNSPEIYNNSNYLCTLITAITCITPNNPNSLYNPNNTNNLYNPNISEIYYNSNNLYRRRHAFYSDISNSRKPLLLLPSSLLAENRYSCYLLTYFGRPFSKPM